MHLKTATSVMLLPARLHLLEQRSAATPVEDRVLNTQARGGRFSLKPPQCESNQVPSQGKCVGGKSAVRGQCSLVLQPNPYPVCQRVSLAASEPRFVWIGLLDRSYSRSPIVLSFFVEARLSLSNSDWPENCCVAQTGSNPKILQPLPLKYWHCRQTHSFSLTLANSSVCSPSCKAWVTLPAN